MSALSEGDGSSCADSQKQYWAVKRYYRDVMLFFKVGKFYELYEDDAQIGHDVLHWRMTITGVGHCRQVQSPLPGPVALVFAMQSILMA